MKMMVCGMDRLESATKKLKTALDEQERACGDIIRNQDEVESKLLERLKLLDEKKLKCTAENGNLDASDNDLIEINAGGKIIAAKRRTLTQLKGTKNYMSGRETRLEGLFNGRWDKKLLRDDSGRIFLDVNGDCFQAIVDFLNEMTISSEEHPSEPPTMVDVGQKQVLAQYLELFGLRIPPQMPDSNIITQYSCWKLLHKWLNEKEGSISSSSRISSEASDIELSLIYHSSKENLSNDNFRSRCANAGNTLIIIETTEGHIVGGYTNENWSSPDELLMSIGYWCKADKSFIFAIGFGMSPCKMDLINVNCKHAIYNCSQYGPAFGGGCAQCDLKVTGSRVYLNTGNIYECGKSEKLTDGHSYTINEMEVFRVSNVSGAHHTHQQHRQFRRPPKRKQVKKFTKEINRVINEKWAELRELEAEMCSLEENFDDEELFITAFASGEGKDILTLNVSGTIMITKRSTLQVTEDSVLARQFDETKWTEQGCSNLRVKEWSPHEVSDWVANIAHIPSDVAALFVMHEVSGSELIALNEFGLEKIGVKRVGTICLLLDEISNLKKTVSEDTVTLIEHSPYCFGKILDYLRLKRLQSEGFIDEAPRPCVYDNQKNRFAKVVKYYFPGESSEYILGVG